MGSLRKKVRDLEVKPRKDFDPEDDSFHRPDEDDSEVEDDAHDDVGREHYESVGKSRLREPARPPILDSKYGGVAVNRKALDEEDEDNPFAPVDESEEDDPFAARNGDIDGSNEDDDIPDDVDLEADIDENSEIDSDEAFGDGDEERFKDFKFRSSKKNRAETQSEDEISDEQSEEDGTDESEDDVTDGIDLDMDDEEDDDEEQDDDESVSSTSTPHKTARNADREELRKAAFSTAGLASALSAGANADVQKGKAVKQQRQTFDRLLDSRIKLQKGLTAMNDISDIILSDDELKQAAQQAEDAALALWSTIDAIRRTILSSNKPDSDSASASRKRPFTATRSTPTEELWEQTSSLDADISSLRRTTLDKWHAKTQPVIDTAPRSKLLGSSQSRSRLTDVLDTYLATESGKLSTASVPSPGTFDDGPFYQALLRDLIASRSASNAGVSSEPFLPTKLHVSGSKGKKVDTKASKGRKVRYTVHEKLENFMAPEDRSTWEDAARREFFASLFGNAGALDEADGVDGVEGEDADGDGDAEVEALRLFRS
ncbi:hypothetical protein PV11_05548 [Exophiala sideris]|uniref:Protein BFR2 n=1 Tax=Exophiala sideris TaxID=1016849 RepID=A0A0D1Z9X6_9EURO|nr:hypothetical protein PV11_05548 [Exophiala sideris]